MLTILLKLFETFTSEIAKRLVSIIGSSKDVCRDLLRLYVVLEELLQQATSAYQVLEEYVNNFDVLKNDVEYRRAMRHEARELLAYLKRFEQHLKKVFLKLKLLDESDLSIKLAEVPESSYSLFKKHFVEDLAPRLIADKSGARYVLRLAVSKTEHSLVSVNKLGHISLDLDQHFKEGRLVYEVIDFSDKSKVSQVLDDCSQDLLQLEMVADSLRALVRNNCDLRKLL